MVLKKNGWHAKKSLPTPQGPVLKIEFGPQHADFGSVWSPQKHVNFYKCIRRQKWVYCVYWQCHFHTLSFPEQIQCCTPLGAYWIVLSVGRMTELMDSLSSSDDRIGGFPQQVRCHLVLIWSIFDRLTWFLTHFGAFRWKLLFETCLSLGPIKTLSQ